MTLIAGGAVGVGGLVVGLLAGSLCGSLEPHETAPRRMRIASGGIILATFVTGCFLAYQVVVK